MFFSVNCVIFPSSSAGSNSGEIGVFNVQITYDSDSKSVGVYWFSLEDETGDAYYFVSTDGVNWGGSMPAACNYDGITSRAYITHNSYSESAPKGSRRYYKISGTLITFYVDFPTDFYGSLYPLKP